MNLIREYKIYSLGISTINKEMFSCIDNILSELTLYKNNNSSDIYLLDKSKLMLFEYLKFNNEYILTIDYIFISHIKKFFINIKEELILEFIKYLMFLKYKLPIIYHVYSTLILGELSKLIKL